MTVGCLRHWFTCSLSFLNPESRHHFRLPEIAGHAGASKTYRERFHFLADWNFENQEYILGGRMDYASARQFCQQQAITELLTFTSAAEYAFLLRKFHVLMYGLHFLSI